MRVRLFFIVPVVALFVVLIPHYAHAEFFSSDDRARLEAQYQEIQKEIAQWQSILDDTQLKKNSLQGDVTMLNAQIKKAEAEIKQRGITISNLTAEINARSAKIKSLDERVVRGQDSLAALLRTVREADNASLPEIILSSKSVSDFFADYDSLIVVERKLAQLFDDIRGAKTKAETERQTLAKQQNQELDAKYVVEAKKKEVAKSESEKNALLAITKNQEATYQKVLAERQQQAAKIRAALFPLRDTNGIAFGTALEYAATASQKTGVRPAFILAILSQESDLGKNVGSCFISNLQTGDGVGKNSGTAFKGVMKAPRDTDPFQKITSALGLPWSTTPVSCPVGGGYGGAMGPSQFIPSTWILYQTRLAKALGVATPNPWDAKDAIMATALYMADLGADAGTYTSERNAACKYYSGRSCDSKKPANSFYGDAVVAKAEAFQSNIDFLKGV
ncbi:MAG: lytic murein transglycosylase [Patescibacteria group bacterium]